jgi:hypothetical protein
MNDILSVARRLREWADGPELPAQMREDMKIAALGLHSLHQMLNATTEEKEVRQ